MRVLLLMALLGVVVPSVLVVLPIIWHRVPLLHLASCAAECRSFSLVLCATHLVVMAIAIRH